MSGLTSFGHPLGRRAAAHKVESIDTHSCSEEPRGIEPAFCHNSFRSKLCGVRNLSVRIQTCASYRGTGTTRRVYLTYTHHLLLLVMSSEQCTCRNTGHSSFSHRMSVNATQV
jgi:hypothetical protein